MIPPTKGSSRTRNAAATRDAMLASARRHFARDSYENVGLREIAGEVGVDPALVSRYFGSKEQLFTECVRGGDEDMMKGVGREGVAEYLTALLLDDEENPEEADQHIDRLLILLRSASSPKASSIIRDTISEDILGPIAAVLDGPDADMRASLSFAVLVGVAILRTAMANDPLCAVDDGQLRKRLVALFEGALASCPDGE
ncbi:TetR/AcrR family transcriptional regulator [Sphingomonas sp. CJ20]